MGPMSGRAWQGPVGHVYGYLVQQNVSMPACPRAWAIQTRIRPVVSARPSLMSPAVLYVHECREVHRFTIASRGHLLCTRSLDNAYMRRSVGHLRRGSLEAGGSRSPQTSALAVA